MVVHVRIDIFLFWSLLIFLLILNVPLTPPRTSGQENHVIGRDRGSVTVRELKVSLGVLLVHIGIFLSHEAELEQAGVRVQN